MMCLSCVNVVYKYQYYPYVHSRKKIIVKKASKPGKKYLKDIL